MAQETKEAPKLTRYAAGRIAELESKVRRLEARLDSPPIETAKIVVNPYDHAGAAGMALKDGDKVRFRLTPDGPNERWIDFTLELGGDQVFVQASGGLTIRPNASNTATLGVRLWSDR